MKRKTRIKRSSRTPLYLILGMAAVLILLFHRVPTAHSVGFSMVKKITIVDIPQIFEEG